MAIIYDYAVLSPDWFRDELQELLNAHDLKNMIGSGSISVSDEHPFVTVQGAIEKQKDPASILPAVAVVERSTDEDPFLGQSAPTEEIVSVIEPGALACVPGCMDERYKDFLVSDADLRQIQDWLNERGPLVAEITKYFIRESCLISCWTAKRQQRTFLGVILMGSLRRIRERLAQLKPRVMDVEIKIARGMINRDFGEFLFGMEATLTFSNWHREIVINGDVPVDPSLPTLAVLADYKSFESDDEPSPILCSD